ncbi:uncharacterized protein LOC114938801 [Nylanderia fulva]|uniref:uncharacterized protein LOC114938801 n=2 Tax=Nylanderia fulva TaxID=613905 RepID=UPI0010FB76A8|nr:uncharacterized protein LOC114938801 [Nylanderia fulva]
MHITHIVFNQIKGQRLYNTNEAVQCENTSGSTIYFSDSTKKHKGSSQVSNLNSTSSQQDANDNDTSYEIDEEPCIVTKEKNRNNVVHNRHVNKIKEVDRSNIYARENRYTNEEKENNNLNDQSSQAAIMDHLKRLTREIATVKYDMRQALSLLDILVDKSNRSTECENTRFSYEGAENRFPLETRAQLTEIEEILKTANSQENTEIRAYIQAIGGTGVDDAVKRTLYKVFSNKLAENYNWEGRRGKYPLQNLELIKVIFRSILHNISDSDRTKIQRRVMEWFRHSKARHNNEKKRTVRDENNGSPDRHSSMENSN